MDDWQEDAIAMGLADEESDINELALDALGFPAALSRRHSSTFRKIAQTDSGGCQVAWIPNFPLPAGRGNQTTTNARQAGQSPGQQNEQENTSLRLLLEHSIKNSAGKDFAETDTDAEFETGLKTLAKKPGLAADARMQAIEAQLAAAETRRVTDKVLTYVEAGKITNEEAEIFVAAALNDETKTFALLDKKEASIPGGSPLSWSGIDILDGPVEAGVREGLTGLRGPQSEMLVNIRKENKTPEARHRIIRDCFDAALPPGRPPSRTKRAARKSLQPTPIPGRSSRTS